MRNNGTKLIINLKLGCRTSSHILQLRGALGLWLLEFKKYSNQVMEVLKFVVVDPKANPTNSVFGAISNIPIEIASYIAVYC